MQYLTITFEGEEKNISFLKNLIEEIIEHRLDGRVEIIDPNDRMHVCPICKGDL